MQNYSKNKRRRGELTALSVLGENYASRSDRKVRNSTLIKWLTLIGCTGGQLAQRCGGKATSQFRF